MSYSYTERYQVIKRTGYKTIPCLSCGKKMKRQKTFTQTINPFNRSKINEGQMKGPVEIIEELNAKIEEWKKTPGMHEACEEKVRADASPAIRSPRRTS